MLLRLTQAISAVCPIDGVAGAQGSVRIDYRPESTEQQRADAQAVLAAFDWSQAAHDAWLEDQHPERKALRQAAANAVADNDAFVADANVTQAEAVAQVKRLSQQMNRVIRRLVQLS